MPRFNVLLTKDYRNPDTGDTLTLNGTMPVQADTAADAEAQVRKMMERTPTPGGGVDTLQTIDPRISWDQSLDDLSDDGYEYVDFTFAGSGVEPADPDA